MPCDVDVEIQDIQAVEGMVEKGDDGIGGLLFRLGRNLYRRQDICYS